MNDFLELKIIPPVQMLICATLVYQVAQFFPISSVLLEYRQYISGVLVVIAISFDFSALFSFYRAKTTANPFKPENASSLVVEGIYQITRNPMYVGLMFLLIAWSVWLGSFYALMVIVLFQQYITRFQICPEERVLTEIFGEQYTNYCQQVRRWL